ncbi:MAG TPA: hypothetical protein VLZ77_05850, partial [Acidimicrobiales bacterium]|nr:hypothetical protein [Acidimicrobiales bacterium]
MPADQNLLLADGEPPAAGADHPEGTRDMEAPWSWVRYESGQAPVPAPAPPPAPAPRPVVAAARVVPAVVTPQRA